jgi:hypothetical protein
MPADTYAIRPVFPWLAAGGDNRSLGPRQKCDWLAKVGGSRTGNDGMIDLFHRLQCALPRVLDWVDDVLRAHAAASRPVDSLGFTRLHEYWPGDLLRIARVVNTAHVPFPPVSEYGLPEFVDMENASLAGITLRDTFFVDPVHVSEAVHFHELVHVVQWTTLGPSDFLLTYGVGLAQCGYENSPLEAIAYDLQGLFENGMTIPEISTVIERHAVEARASAAAVLARHGLRMG